MSQELIKNLKYDPIYTETIASKYSNNLKHCFTNQHAIHTYSNLD